MEISVSLFAKTSRAVSLLAIIALGTGCANQVHLTRADYASLHSVAVTKQPGIVENVFYLPIGQAIGAQFGVVGALASVAASGNDRAYLAQKMADPATNPAHIVGEVFESRICTSGIFSAIASHGDATFVFHVKRAGLGIPHGFTARMEPCLIVQAQLVKNDGRIIWDRTERVLPADSAGGKHGNVDLMHDPAALQEAFRAAANMLVNRWIGDILQDIGQVQKSTKPTHEIPENEQN